jgi:hypothetical protein
MTKPLSRPKRWAQEATAAVSAIEALVELQQEYQEWYDNLPENLQNSPVGEKLQAICDLDLEGAFSTLQEADGADLPMGFGKD